LHSRDKQRARRRASLGMELQLGLLREMAVATTGGLVEPAFS
jgi:hypothetical protein